MNAEWRCGVIRDSGGPPTARPTVVKLGGSLLDRPGWPGRCAAILHAVPGPRLVVVGGGPLVDGLRAVDRAEPQPADLMHGLAIACMGLTARLVAAALGVPLVAEPDRDGPPTAVLDAPAWLARGGRLDRLPVGWDVTSDSIAALVAADHGLPLVLVKSVPPPHDDIDRLAATGWVDEFFPTAARPLAHLAWVAPG